MYPRCPLGPCYLTVSPPRLLQALADMVEQKHLDEGRVYPPLQGVREVSTQLATRIVEYAYRTGIAATYPEPDDKLSFVRDHQYCTDYDSFVPDLYSWPGMID